MSNQVKAQLEKFVTKADQLAACRVVQNGGLNTSFTINYKDGVTTMESKEPDEEELRSMLLILRQFVAKKEPLFLDRIYNLCEQHLSSDDVRGLLRQARGHWKASQKESWFNMQHGDSAVTPTYMADLWINGHYFHSDPELEKKLESLVGEEAIFTRHVFLGFVSETVNQVLYMAHTIRIAMERDLFSYTPDELSTK